MCVKPYAGLSIDTNGLVVDAKYSRTQLYRIAEPLTDLVVTRTGFFFSTQNPHIFHQALSGPGASSGFLA